MKLTLEFDLPDEAGWDGHRGTPPSEYALNTVKALHVTPMSGGELMLELHAGGAHLEIEIGSDGNVESVSTEWRSPDG